MQHIHRVGRASRGGRSGWATNFYDATSADLVNSLLLAAADEAADDDDSRSNDSISRRSDYDGGGDSDRTGVVEKDVEDGSEEEEEGDQMAVVKKGTVERSFSRRRGFRKRIKRRIAAQQLGNTAAIEEG